MKTSRLPMVSLLALFIVSAGFSSVWSECNSGNAYVAGWWPKFWYDQNYGCRYGALVDTLEVGAARLGAEALVYCHSDIDNPPDPLITFV